MTEHFDPQPSAAEMLAASVRDMQEQDRMGQATYDETIRGAFDIADGLFRDAAEDFTRLRERLRGEASGGNGAGKGASKRAGGKAARPEADLGDGLKDAVKLARELRAATQLMLEERNRVDRLRKEIAGGVGAGGALDLDAARDEIGRRLACLRRATGS